MTHDDLEFCEGAKRKRLDGQSCLDGQSQEWSLRLTAISADEPERLVRFLTGALLACGGWVRDCYETLMLGPSSSLIQLSSWRQLRS